MRISDWSSDVCSSDLSPSVLQQIAEYLVDFARLKSQAPSLKEEPVPQTPPFPIWRQRHSQSANPRIHMVQSRCVGPIQSRRDSKPNISSRSEEHTSELQSLMRISYAVFCLKKKTTTTPKNSNTTD